MFGSLYFRGCKYTNKILFINKNIVFQHFVLLITCHLERFPVKPGMTEGGRSGMTKRGSLSSRPGSSLSSRPSGASGEISTPGVPPRKTECHPSRSATTDRPTTFGAILCRTVPKMAVKHPKTGPSIMFFAILMSDGQLTTLPSRKIPGQAGNDGGRLVGNDERTLPCHLDRAERVERSAFYDKLRDFP